MLVIPLAAVPSQVVSTILDSQQVTLTLRQLEGGLFMNVANNNREVVGLVICQNENLIVRNSYLGLEGDFAFFDTEGRGADPEFSGLGTRFQLVFLSASELPGGGA